MLNSYSVCHEIYLNPKEHPWACFLNIYFQLCKIFILEFFFQSFHWQCNQNMFIHEQSLGSFLHCPCTFLKGSSCLPFWFRDFASYELHHYNLSHPIFQYRSVWTLISTFAHSICLKIDLYNPPSDKELGLQAFQLPVQLGYYHFIFYTVLDIAVLSENKVQSKKMPWICSRAPL